MAIVTAAFVHFPQPDRSEPEWRVFWQGYVTTCGHLSRAAVEAGMLKWLADPQSQFLPKPGELRYLASQTPTEAHQDLAKARAILEAVKSEAHRERIDADIKARGTTKEAQAAAIRAMLTELQAELSAGAKRDREAMFGKGPAFPNRVRIPQGPLNETQKRMLRACGIVV